MKRGRTKSLSIITALLLVIGVMLAGFPMMTNASDAVADNAMSDGITEIDCENAESSEVDEIGDDETTAEIKNNDLYYVYVVYVSFDLQGGEWGDQSIDGYVLETEQGQNIDPDRFKGQGVIPVKNGFIFKGWTAILTDMEGNTIDYLGDDAVWDFDSDGISYSWGENVLPDESELTFIAVWVPVETETEIKMLEQTSVWYKGSGETATFISNAEFDDFLSVSIDGEVVECGDGANYDVEEGSTKVILTAQYLETLSVGKHSVEITSTTGTAKGEIEIREAREVKVGKVTPKTGDNNMAGVVAILMLTGAAVIVGLAKRRFN